MTRTEIIREAVAYWNWKWPDELWTGIMFFKGERITLGEFHAALAAQSNQGEKAE